MASVSHLVANNPWQFQKGFDPRRSKRHYYNGQSLGSLCRNLTGKALEVIKSAMEDEECPWPTRVAAAGMILDRGHGRAPTVIEMNVNQNVKLMTRSEIRARLSAELAGAAIEGELVSDNGQSISAAQIGCESGTADDENA